MPPKAPAALRAAAPPGLFAPKNVKICAQEKTGERKSFHLFFIFGGIHNGKKRNLWKQLNFFETLDGGGLNR